MNEVSDFGFYSGQWDFKLVKKILIGKLKEKKRKIVAKKDGKSI